MSKNKQRTAQLVSDAKVDENVKSGNIPSDKSGHVVSWLPKRNVIRVENVATRPYDGDPYINKKGENDTRQVINTIEFDVSELTDLDLKSLAAKTLVIKAQTPMKKAGKDFLTAHTLIRINGKSAGKNLPLSPLAQGRRAATLMNAEERAEHRAMLDELDAIEAAETE